MSSMNTMKTENEFRELIQGAIEQHGTQSALADAIGITPQYLSDILKARRSISEHVASFFGYKRVVLFVVPVDGNQPSPALAEIQAENAVRGDE